MKSARGSIGWSEAGEADPGEGSTAPSILSPLLELARGYQSWYQFERKSGDLRRREPLQTGIIGTQRIVPGKVEGLVALTAVEVRLLSGA